MKQGLLNKFRKYSFKRVVTYCVLEVFILQTTFSCVALAQIPVSSFSEEDIGITVTPLLKRTPTPLASKFMMPEAEETVNSAYQVNISRKEEAVSFTCKFTKSGEAIYSAPELTRESTDHPLLGLVEITSSDTGMIITVPGKNLKSSFLSFILDRDGNTEFSEVRHAAALHFETTGDVYFPKKKQTYFVGSLNLLADQVKNSGTLKIKRKGTSSIQVREFLNEKGATLEAEASFYGKTTTLEIIADLYVNHGWIESQVLVERARIYRNRGSVKTERRHNLEIEEGGTNYGYTEARDFKIEGGLYYQPGKIKSIGRFQTDLRLLENTGEIDGVWIDAKARKLQQKGDMKGHQVELKGLAELLIGREGRLESKRSMGLTSRDIQIDGFIRSGTSLDITGDISSELYISETAQLLAQNLTGRKIGHVFIEGTAESVSLFATKKIDIEATLLWIKQHGRLHGSHIKLKTKNKLSNKGLIIGNRKVDLSFGELDHRAEGIIASGRGGVVEIEGRKASLRGRVAILEQTEEGGVLYERDPVDVLKARITEEFYYDPERLTASRLLALTFDTLPDLKAGIRTSSALQLRVNSGLGTLRLKKPIFAKGGVDLKALGVNVIFFGDAASFESDKDISVESKALDLKGRVFSKRGVFTTNIEESLKIRSDIEAARVYLKSGSLGFGLVKDLPPLKREFLPDPLTNLSVVQRESVKRALDRRGVTLRMFKRIDLGAIRTSCFSGDKTIRQKRRDFANALDGLIREARAAEISAAREDAAWEREKSSLMPTVFATEDLRSDKAALLLDADVMDLANAKLHTPGAISITNKAAGDFRLAERFKANGYHVDTHGNIIIERPLRVEGEYGLRLTTPKTLRIGRGGHLVEVHTLRGPLELSAHLLDLRWAQLFSEQDMTLTSKTDITLGTGKLSSKTHQRDGARSVKFYLPNGAYLQTSGPADFYFGNQMLIDNASVHIIGDMRLGHFDRTSPAVLFNLIAAHLRVDGNAYPHVRKIENTIYDIFRKEYGLEGAYTKAYFDAETSRPSHIRIARDLIADRMPNVRNVSSIVNIIGKIAVAGTVVSPSGFFRNETREIESDSHHHRGGWNNGCYRKTRTATIADIIVGRDAAISADGVIQTGRFRAGGVAIFRGSHDFYSENIDPEGRQGGIRVTFPELDSVLFKRNPDPKGPVMIPRAPIRLRYGLPINPQMVFVHPGVYFSGDRPVRHYLSPQALDHVLAMQVGTDIEVSKLSPPEMLARLENNTRTFMEKGQLALPMSSPQPLLMDAGVKETRMVPMNPMTTLSMINPSHVSSPMVLWGIKMMDGYPTMMPAFIRRIDTTRTGHTSARRLELFYGNKIHLVGATVQGRESLKARAPRLLMEAAYYTTRHQIDEDTHEEGHVPVRASAIAGEGKKLGEFDIKVDETLMAGARSRGRGTFHSNRLRAIGAVETTTRKHVSKESGFSGKRKEEVDSEQKHTRDLFEGELNEEGDDFADLTGVHFAGRHEWRYPQIFLRAPQDRRYHMHQSFERGFAVNTSKVSTDDSTIYGPAVTTDGFVEFNADGILVQDSRMRPMNMTGIDLAAGNIVRRWVSDRHHSYSDTQYSAGAGLQVAIAIGAGMATGGIGSTWIPFLAGAAQGASAAAISHLATSAINGQDPFTRDLIKTIAFQAVTQGLSQGALHSAYGSINAEGLRVLPGATTFGGHLGRAAIRTGVSTGTNWAVYGGRGADILTQAGLSIAATTAGSYGTSTIGDAYWHGGLGYVGHKVLHAMLGAATGAVASWDDPWVGAASGAVGAMTAEMVMEAAIGSPAELRQAYGEGEPVKLWDARESSSTLRARAEWVQGITRMGIAMASAYAGGNPYIADASADRVIRNNFFAHMPKIEMDEDGNIIGFSDDHSEYLEYGRIIDEAPIPGVTALIELTQKVPLITRNLRAALAYSGVGDAGLSYSERMAMHQAAMSVPDISLGQTLDVMLPHTFGELAFDIGVGYATAGAFKIAKWGYSATRASALGGLFGKEVLVEGAHLGQGITRRTILAKDYIRDMVRRSGFEFQTEQKELLTAALRERRFVKLSPEAKYAHSKEFSKARECIVAQWEANTGQRWPRYKRMIKGELKEVKADLHHIIPQEYGGPHAWWNAKPLEFGKQHQGGVHGKGSPLSKLEGE